MSGVGTPAAAGPPAAKRPAKAAGDRDPTWTDLPWGMFVVIAGLLAVVAVAVVAILHYGDPADVATAASPFTGVIVGIVGTYFGVRGATQAQQKANDGERIRRPRD